MSYLLKMFKLGLCLICWINRVYSLGLSFSSSYCKFLKNWRFAEDSACLRMNSSLDESASISSKMLLEKSLILEVSFSKSSLSFLSVAESKRSRSNLFRSDYSASICFRIFGITYSLKYSFASLSISGSFWKLQEFVGKLWPKKSSSLKAFSLPGSDSLKNYANLGWKLR